MSVRRVVRWVLILGIVSCGLAWREKRRLVPASEILPLLYREPVQVPIEDKPFAFSYKGHPYNVRPKAAYELWGLVVSHNDINSLADIYHTENAVDTKDVCVVWGNNVATDGYRRVKFWNGPWTCNMRYPEGVRLNPGQVSNNHLITNSETLRRAIAQVHVGDQIHLKGWLVDYQDAAYPDFWRRSSLTRADMGNGACEVVFVKDLETLKPGAPDWWLLFRISLWALSLALAAEIYFFFMPEPARGDPPPVN